MNKIDAWCQRSPIPGLKVCKHHGGALEHSKKAAERRVKEMQLQQGAEKIIKKVR
jgi:hypothetical protein